MEPHQLIRKIDDRILYKVTEGLSLGELNTTEAHITYTPCYV